jgi:putative membrane protein
MQARERVPELTAILSVVSLALVFGAVGGYIPETVLPHVSPLVSVIPHLNALISAAAIVTIVGGVRAIKNGNVSTHRRAMLTTTGLFALFLVLYLYRVSLEGPTPFTGQEWVKLYVYLPMLAIHILLAIACVPLVYYALLLAWAHDVRELPSTNHPRVGRVAAALWLISFSLGICVYLILYVL